MKKNKHPSAIIKCPKCSKKLDYYKSQYRPFCSKLCQLEDLANWASGAYSVIVPDQQETIDTANDNLPADSSVVTDGRESDKAVKDKDAPFLLN